MLLFFVGACIAAPEPDESWANGVWDVWYDCRDTRGATIHGILVGVPVLGAQVDATTEDYDLKGSFDARGQGSLTGRILTDRRGWREIFFPLQRQGDQMFGIGMHPADDTLPEGTCRVDMVRHRENVVSLRRRAQQRN